MILSCLEPKDYGSNRLVYDAIEAICDRPAFREIDNILQGKLEPLITVNY